MYDRDTTKHCSACAPSLSISLLHVIACCIHAISAPSSSLTFTHTHTSAYLTYLYICSHTHRHLLSSFVKSQVCTHRGACSFDTFTHVHSLIHTHARTLAIETDEPKKGSTRRNAAACSFCLAPIPRSPYAVRCLLFFNLFTLLLLLLLFVCVFDHALWLYKQL